MRGAERSKRRALDRVAWKKKVSRRSVESGSHTCRDAWRTLILRQTSSSCPLFPPQFPPTAAAVPPPPPPPPPPRFSSGQSPKPQLGAKKLRMKKRDDDGGGGGDGIPIQPLADLQANDVLAPRRLLWDSDERFAKGREERN